MFIKIQFYLVKKKPPKTPKLKTQNSKPKPKLKKPKTFGSPKTKKFWASLQITWFYCMIFSFLLFTHSAEILINVLISEKNLSNTLQLYSLLNLS